jgi:hypothetical protein
MVFLKSHPDGIDPRFIQKIFSAIASKSTVTHYNSIQCGILRFFQLSRTSLWRLALGSWSLFSRQGQKKTAKVSDWHADSFGVERRWRLAAS